METTIKKAAKINQSITFKALIIGFLTLILLIPGFMIQDLIRERSMPNGVTPRPSAVLYSLSPTRPRMKVLTIKQCFRSTSSISLLKI